MAAYGFLGIDFGIVANEWVVAIRGCSAWLLGSFPLDFFYAPAVAVDDAAVGMVTSVLRLRSLPTLQLFLFFRYLSILCCFFNSCAGCCWQVVTLLVCMLLCLLGCHALPIDTGVALALLVLRGGVLSFHVSAG